MTKQTKLPVFLLLCAFFMQALQFSAFAEDAAPSIKDLNLSQYGFESLKEQGTPLGEGYYLEHKKTGAKVFYLDSGEDRREFSIGFKTPPQDNKGANHVLEHSLLCGSEKYPTKNIINYLQANSLAELINAYTASDVTYYSIKTPNETEYYNLMDVYMNGILHPLLPKEENIFKQQGIRLEYTADGKVQYNGVVYNELRLKSFDSVENSIYFVSDQLYKNLYGDTAPVYNDGGTVSAIKELTYEDVLRVYNTYYTPSNSLIYIAGNQDIKKTLELLNDYLNEFSRKTPSIQFQDTKKIPDQEIERCNITADTKTVDIGFMSAGVPLSDQKASAGRSVLLDMISKKLEADYPSMYTTGGNTGGLSNSALLLAGVPTEQADTAIAAYKQAVQQLYDEPIPPQTLSSMVDSSISYLAQMPYIQTESVLFDGFLYTDDPFSFLDPSPIIEELKNDPGYLKALLKESYIDSPYQSIVISGNGDKTDDSVPQVTPEQLDQIKKDTEAFYTWADTPDSPEVIASIPTLKLSDFQDDPSKQYQIHKETIREIPYYCTFTDDIKNPDSDRLDIATRLSIPQDQWLDLSLLQNYLSSQLSESGLSGFYMDINPMMQYFSPEQMQPVFELCVVKNDDMPLEEKMEKLVSLLQDGTLFCEDALAQYAEKAIQSIKQSYNDPYFMSYELMRSAMSSGGTFQYIVTGSTHQGSAPYYQYLKNIKNTPEQNGARIENLKALLDSVLVNDHMRVEYMGPQEDFNAVKESLPDLLASLEQKDTGILYLLPMGYDSAATVSNLGQDVNHIMLAAKIGDTAHPYSGKLEVLGSLVSSKYLMPQMRGKYGAYGAGMHFTNDSMTCFVSGIHDVDLAISVWQGIGDYLRNLSMDQSELNGIIISTVNQYDQYTNAAYGAYLAATGRSSEDISRIRREILDTTVADIKNYADFIDALIAQNHVFAVTDFATAQNTDYQFSYLADAQELTVTPVLNQDTGGYLNGTSETTFSPDKEMTRAELAALFSRIMADRREYEKNDRFTDISSDSWYASPVNTMAAKSLLSGYEDGTFHPDQPVTRAEFAKIASQFIFSASGAAQAFPDVPQSHWAYGSIMKMAENGYLSGYEDGTFRPNQPVTRAEAVTVINKMLKKTGSAQAVNPFTDVPQTHWAYQAILAAAA